MKYFYDTEFIEDGKTIDLISIGIVSEDGRELYLQNLDCRFERASEWVARNVFPSLSHFHPLGRRICFEWRDAQNFLAKAGGCKLDDCPWRAHYGIRGEVRDFCDPEKYGKPEFWGYYSAYDHVALCQLFGAMIGLPKGWPMYTRDIKQWCDALGNPKLPEQGKGEHHALADAKWNRAAYYFLESFQREKESEARLGGWSLAE